MKIVVINGSAKGKSGNTNVMVEALLKGATRAGAAAASVFLSEKEIRHCKACHVCWTRGPGQCVIDDDFGGILAEMGGADVIAFATPVYFGNISGMLKVFMDRMTMIGSPHERDDVDKSARQTKGAEAKSPKLLILSSCGFPDRGEFQVISLWMRVVAKKMGMELIGEIYATQGKFLGSPPEESRAAVADYLLLLEKAGKDIAQGGRLSESVGAGILEYGISGSM